MCMLNFGTDAGISIHALHEESDGFVSGHVALPENFNPRSP